MLHAVGHARGEGALTRFLRRERQVADERRDTVLLSEFNRHDAGIAGWHGEVQIARIEVLLMDELRRVVDIGVRAEEAELLAVVAVSPQPPVLAADADIHVAHRHVPAGIALPLLHEFGSGMCIPHQLAGRIERTCDANGAITRQGNFCGPGHGLLHCASS